MLRFLATRRSLQSFRHSQALFASSARLEVFKEKKGLEETANMSVSEILVAVNKHLNKNMVVSKTESKNFRPSAALRHLAWKVQPVSGPTPKFGRKRVVKQVTEPTTVVDLCEMASFQLLLQNLNKNASQMSVEEINDIVSAAARRDFTVNLRALDTSRPGKQEVPVLRAVMQRAISLLRQLPFRTLLRTMVVLSRDELGFERDIGFTCLAQELIDRTEEGPIMREHWMLLSRSLQDMAENLLWQDVTSDLAVVIADLVKHFRKLLEQENQASVGDLIVLIQALTTLDVPKSFEWLEIRKSVLAKAAQIPYPNTLMHITSLDSHGLLKDDISCGLVHSILADACSTVGGWSTLEVARALGTLVQLGYRSEYLLRRISERLIELVALNKVDEPTARLALLALAKLNYSDQELCLVLCSVCLRNPPKEGRVLKIMSSLWALAVLNVYVKDVFETGWKLCDAEEPIRLRKGIARKLVGFHLTLTKEQPEWEFCRSLPKSMSFALFHMNWRMYTRPNSSKFHLQVQGAISRMGTGAICRNEKFNNASKTSVDITLYFPDGSRLAVECNGPSHYLRPSGYHAPPLSVWPLSTPEPPATRLVPCGETLFKQRTLIAAGMMVLQIPWYEWYRVNKTNVTRSAYMKEKLHAMGIPTMVTPLHEAAKVLAKFRQREIDLQQRKQFVTSLRDRQVLEDEMEEVSGLLSADAEPTPGLIVDQALEEDEEADASFLQCGPILATEPFGYQPEEELDETVETIFASRNSDSGKSYLTQFKGTALSDKFWVYEKDIKNLPGFRQAEHRFRVGAPEVEDTGGLSFTYRDPVSTMPTMEELAARFFPDQPLSETEKPEKKKPKKKRKPKT